MNDDSFAEPDIKGRDRVRSGKTEDDEADANDEATGDSGKVICSSSVSISAGISMLRVVFNRLQCVISLKFKRKYQQ
jgi:hypothetical protein